MGLDDRLLRNGHFPVAFAQCVIKQPVGQGLIPVDHGRENQHKRNDNHDEQDYEEHAQPKHPFPGLCLFRIYVFLKSLEYREVVRTLRRHYA